MGNSQSQEAEDAALAEDGADDQPFDISLIPDDRDSAERDARPTKEIAYRPERSIEESPDAGRDMAKRTDMKSKSRSKKKQGKGKKRTRGQERTSDVNSDTNGDALTHQSPPAANMQYTTEDHRPLRDTEPETYHIYATSDQSDLEDGQRAPRGSTNNFVAVNQSSQAKNTRKSNANDGYSESERADVDLPAIESPEAEVQTLNPPVSVGAARRKSGAANSHIEVTVPSSKSGDQNRFPCPSADVYRCDKTFSSRKGALRHAKLHSSTGVQAGPVTAAVPIEVPTESTATQLTRQMPEPTVNSQGRFCCPLAEVENCGSTFGDRKSAVRHAHTHTATEFVCIVCKKRLSRKDKLVSHLKKHSAPEIAAAFSASAEAITEPTKPIEEAEEQQPTDHAADGTEVEVESEAMGEFAGPEAESPAEFTTPQEIPSAQEGGVSTEEAMDDAQDGADSELPDAEPIVDGSEDISERQSSAQSSIFDEEMVVVEETPMPTEKRKRKRDKEMSSEATKSSPGRSRKRRKGTSDSPPTSIPSNGFANLETPKNSLVTAAARRRQNTDKIVPQLQPRQGSIDGWAKKFVPGSGLKHPSLNPTPPRPGTQQVEVIIPRTSQPGPSGTKAKAKAKSNSLPDEPMNVDEGKSVRTRRQKPNKATYETPKGKNRAEPDVEYSTPAKSPTNDEADVSGSDQASAADIATSVAKRTFPREGNGQVESQDSTDGSESDVNRPPDSESDMERPAKKARKALPGKSATATQKNSRGAGATSPDPAARFECLKCHRTFPSQEQLHRHQKKRGAHVGLLKCSSCSEEFYAATSLARHEKDTGHGRGNGSQGRTGAFSQSEVDRLNNWRDQFCKFHDISTAEFNDMMTATLERGKAGSWQWAFIKRDEFMTEYVSVLPNRNKRSLLRYRERNFQNLEGMKNWTDEDDSELIRLHSELGPKWVEIARRLGRNADAVSQRWRHKLQYNEVASGAWSEKEKTKFAAILNDLVKELDGKELEEGHIPWNKVSEKMETRSAQQCSNRYRVLHSKKKHGLWVKIDALEKTPGSSRILTQSKMELRLSGQKAKGGKNRSNNALSEEFIREEDDGDDEAGAEEKVSEDEEERLEEADGVDHQSDSNLAEIDDSPARTDSENDESSPQPKRNRNPFSIKTPGKSLQSSQLFEQTQANTSALKPSQASTKKRKQQASQDRPSPNVPIQHQRRRSRSPLSDLDVLEEGKPDGEGEDGNDDADESADRRDLSQDLGILDEIQTSEDESDEADDREEIDQKPSREDSVDEEETAQTDNEEQVTESENETSDGKPLVDEQADMKEVSSDEESQPTEDEETPGGAEAVSSSDESEDGEEDSDDVQTAQPPASSFIANINESAKRANIKKVRTGSGTNGQSRSQTLMGLPVPRVGRRDIWQQESDDGSD